MHEHTNHEAAHRATSQVQRCALLHAQMPNQPALGEEVRGQLHTTPKSRADHSGADTAVETPNPLGAVDLTQAIGGVTVLVLGADGQEGTEALEAGLDKEKRRARGGADNTRRGAAEHVDAQALDFRVPLVQERRQRPAHRLVETQAAAVEQHLVDVRAPDPTVDALDALIPHDDADAVEGAPVVVRLVAFRLEFAL